MRRRLRDRVPRPRGRASRLGHPALRPRADDGSVSLLVLGYTLICLALVAVVVDATAVHLARTQLLDAADAAALAAADAIDERSVYRDGVGDQLPVAPAAVRDEALAYLAAYDPPSRIDRLRLAGATGSADGTATVTLAGRVRLPVAASVVAAYGGGITVSVTSTARSTLVP